MNEQGLYRVSLNYIEYFHIHVCHLPQHSWVYLVRAHEFLQFPQVFPDLILFHQRYILLAPAFQPGLRTVGFLKGQSC